MFTDVQNYDEVHHKHTKKCTNIDINGVCRFDKQIYDFMFENNNKNIYKKTIRIFLRESFIVLFWYFSKVSVK